MWTKYAYNVGGLLFTLDEIEHGVLRCNKGHPKDEKPMFTDEARKSLSLSFLDPRIHFALNCGATSCPPIRLLKISRLNKIAIFKVSFTRSTNNKLQFVYVFCSKFQSRLQRLFRQFFQPIYVHILQLISFLMNK